MGVIIARFTGEKGLCDIVFNTTEKEEAEVGSKQREVTKGRTTVEMMLREPQGRFYEGGRNFKDQTSLQGSRVLEKLNMVCIDMRGDRHAGLSAKDVKLKLANKKSCFKPESPHLDSELDRGPPFFF